MQYSDVPQSEFKQTFSDAGACTTRPGYFPSTQWSVVLAAGGTRDSAANAALENLLSIYWKPLYCYVRRRGQIHHDAEDLIQAFFQHLLEKDVVGHASKERGRFRCFLLGSMQNFLANEHDRATALKRGGSQPHFSLDELDVGDHSLPEPATQSEPPERLFDREWAQTLFTNALQRLEAEFSGEGKAAQFNALARFLSQPAVEGAYDQVAKQIGVRPGLMPTLVSRLRKRFRDLVRVEIAATVATPIDVDEELRYLVELMAC